MKPEDPRVRLAEYNLADAEERLRFQHDYTLAGLKTLILMNGGAIIGLLTYAGNASGSVAVESLRASFTGYIVGLMAAALAYLTAYLSQAFFMTDSSIRGHFYLGAQPSQADTADKHRRRGTVSVVAGVILCVASLGGFAVGSLFAVSSIAAQHHQHAKALPSVAVPKLKP